MAIAFNKILGSFWNIQLSRIGKLELNMNNMNCEYSSFFRLSMAKTVTLYHS